MYKKSACLIFVLFLILQFAIADSPPDSGDEISAEDEENTTTEEVKKPSKTVVSICEGCIVGGSCIDAGVQKQEMIGGPIYYCDTDHKAKPAKDIGGVCVDDYECEYYFCDNGYCNVRLEGEGVSTIMIFIIIGLIIILGAGAVLLLKLRKGVKKIAKEEKKMKKEEKKLSWPKRTKGIKPIAGYKYHPEFDTLEKKLKKWLKKK
jgi:hypothetical protein